MHTRNIEIYDIFSLLESRFEAILNKLTEAESIALRMLNSTEISMEYGELKNIIETVYPDIYMTIDLEKKYLYPELKNILPDQSSVEAIAEEHTSIIGLLFSIRENLRTKDIFFCNIYNIQSQIIGLIDIVQRNIHKKENIMFYEAQALPDETLKRIYNDSIKELDQMLLKYSEICNVNQN